MSSPSRRSSPEGSERADSPSLARIASAEAAAGRAAELTAVAEALGIPWERLIEAEIAAERKLRSFVGDPDAAQPLWRFLSALPATALDSWRVRERLGARIRDARLTRSGAAARAVREAVDELCGKSRVPLSPSQALATHLTLAHERIRELARVARAAPRVRGSGGERVARLVERTGCTSADADWALARLEAPGRSHAIDDAVRKARAEGFEIPVAETEFHSFLALHKLVKKTKLARPRAPRAKAAASLHRPRLAS